MLTPRQFDAQISVHEDVTKKLHGVDEASKVPNKPSTSGIGYIDQIPGW